MIGPLPEDIKQERMLERGSRWLHEAVTAVLLDERPIVRTKLLWGATPRNNERDPDSQSSALSREWLERREADMSDTQWAKRDPCPRCGTRMDYGCKHVEPQ